MDEKPGSGLRGNQQYLPDTERRKDPLASPLRTPDLSASPAALVLSAGLDPLRDEGEAYGHRLSSTGVPTEVVRCEGVVHGFLAMVNYAPSAGKAFDHIVEGIDKATSYSARVSSLDN